MGKRRAKTQPQLEQQTMGDMAPKTSAKLKRALDGYRDAMKDKSEADKELKLCKSKAIDQMKDEEITSIDFTDANGNSKTLCIEQEDKLKLRKKAKPVEVSDD
tara:strand:+ start:251 stop:559 length:309 start_codon:yes stop_codon:yes gene_type:complete